MPVQRKIFSIEQLTQSREALEQAEIPDRAPTHDKVGQNCASELVLLQETVGRVRAEIAGFKPAGGNGMARASRELQAVVTETVSATQAILQAAEDIDDAANTLSAAVKTSHEQELAHDIRDAVIQIFEACNFQDVSGQRLHKVTTTLASVETQLARLIDACAGGPFCPHETAADPTTDRRFLNGPKLRDESGHSTQTDIDRIFRRA
jgi:chemotaxis protein CheZ